MAIYSTEASGSGNFLVLTSTSYKAARKKARSLRNGLHSEVYIIKGLEIEYGPDSSPHQRP